jgi:hypothetical protein
MREFGMTVRYRVYGIDWSNMAEHKISCSGENSKRVSRGFLASMMSIQPAQSPVY